MLSRTIRRIKYLQPFSYLQKINQQLFSESATNFESLKSQFQKERDMLIFTDMIKNSNTPLENINYFKIYKILQDSGAESKHYEDFFYQAHILLKKKSDNMRMLLAKVKVKIAKISEH